MKERNYLLGYILQIVGLVLFRAYLTVLITAYEVAFLPDVNSGIRHISHPYYSKVYHAFAANITMLLVTSAIIICGIVFVVKNKPKNNSRFKILKRARLIFILLLTFL